MKKLFRTLLAMIIAVVMSFAVFAIAGCNNGGNDGDEKGGETGGETTETLNYGKFGKLLNTEYKAVTADVEFKEVETDGDYEDEFSVKVRANLDGDADFSMKMPAYSSEAEFEYYYSFVRDWKIYTVDASETEITDFTSVELTGMLDVKEVVEKVLAMDNVALPEDIVDTSALGEIVPVTMSAVNYLVLGLADAAEAVTDENGVITVDLNLAAYNMVSDIAEVVDGLTEDTTVAQLLVNPKLSKYLKVITELAKPQDIVDLLVSVIDSISSNENVPEEQKSIVDQIKAVIDACTPDEGSTTLDYVVKVLNHLELGSKKVSELLAAYAPDLTIDGIKGMVEEYKTMFEADKVYYYEDYTFENFKMVYNYTGDHVLTSQKLTVTINAGDYVMTPSATITYSAEKYTDLKTLPSELPEIPEFDTSDWFPEGPGGNEEEGTITSPGTNPPSQVEVEEIGGHTFVMVRVYMEAEEDANSQYVSLYEQMVIAINSAIEDGQIDTIEFLSDYTLVDSSAEEDEVFCWKYGEDDHTVVYVASSIEELEDPEVRTVFYLEDGELYSCQDIGEGIAIYMVYVAIA